MGIGPRNRRLLASWPVGDVETLLDPVVFAEGVVTKPELGFVEIERPPDV
jgi:hypothetical protein